MDRSSSNSSNLNSSGSDRDIFTYQKQLLERKSSLSRSNSRTGGIFNTPTAHAPGTGATHKWLPGHKSAQSVDVVRSKWEERARESSPERDISNSQPSPTRINAPSPTSPIKPTIPLSTRFGSTGATGNGLGKEQVDAGLTPKRKMEPPSLALSRQKTLPLTPVTNIGSVESSIPSSPVRRIDSIRSKWERTSPERPVKEVLPPSPSKARASNGVSTPITPSALPLTPDSTGSTVLTRSDSVSSTSSLQRINSIRSKWETRERELAASERIQLDDPFSTTRRDAPSTSSLPPTSSWSTLATTSSPSTSTFAPSSASSSLDDIRMKWGLPPRDRSPERESKHKTPPSQKRHTLPAPITEPLLPEPHKTPTKKSSVTSLASNNIASNASFATPPPNRIHLSTSTDLQSSSVSAVKRLGNFAVPSPERTPKAELKSRRAELIEDDYKPPPLSPSASAMFPTPYTSSAQKKYGSSLTDGRRLGRHLPRIASGDGESPVEDSTPLQRRSARRRKRVQEPSEELVIPGITGASDVTGVPGRLRLARASKANTPAPLPSSRLTTGLWADVQRNLLQAYEYLCHVGEAQQWIEGCLGEELEFGVVEMEDGLRNGVVLAKLVRAFEGDAAVKRIYEAPKLDYRHSDNINHFLQFVRRAGLPECFIFETLDLYEKKNFPKVIYSIHALSHLLARRGMAERIGNLLGQLKFSDDQLHKTQKGLEHSGLPLPNFGSVGRELAKEINEEPEVEPETEDEKRDRLLLENEASIIKLQTQARAYMIRQNQTTQRACLRLAEPTIQKVQARCRAVLTRRMIARHRKQQSGLVPWVVKLQAVSRGLLVRRSLAGRYRLLAARVRDIIKLQAQARAVLQRRRFNRLRAALKSCKFSVTKLQTLSRARLARKTHKELKKSLDTSNIAQSITTFQGVARGVIRRRKEQQRHLILVNSTPSIVNLQSQVRGVLIRRRVRNQMAKLTDITDIIVRIQAAARAYLAGKRLLNLIRGLRRATTSVVGLQARAKAAIARRRHREMCKALVTVKVVQSVGGLQAFARAALARNRQKEQTKRLEFCAPDVVGLQATCRGHLARTRYWSWRNHLHSSINAVIHLQSLLRGVVQRRKFRAKMAYYRANLDKVVQIQSLMRAKDTREQYRRLTLGQNVNVSTIKNFVHLLDDSEADFKEEIEVEKLRERLVKHIRENQALETDVSELDVKIALMVQNVKSFEELVKVRRRHGADSAAAHATRASVLAAHGDPFAGPNTLDHATKRKLELYQQLFYLLQTRSDYLAKLLFAICRNDLPDKMKKLCERVVLALFNYGQNRREEILLLKFFQHAIHEEVDHTPSASVLAKAYPLYMNIAVHYVRPKQVSFVRDAFQGMIREVIEQEDLDLETDPAALHRNRVNIEEMRTGRISSIPKEVSFHEAIENHYPETRGEYIRNLQRLQVLTKGFVQAILESTKKMPYGMRYIALETLSSLKSKFPDEPQATLAACVGRLIYYRFINTAIVAPETFDIVQNTISPVQRKNLAAISKVLTQIASGKLFDNDEIAMVPLNDYVTFAISQISSWFLEVANVAQPDVQLDAYEFLDVALQPKPIFISPNEVYSAHSLLMKHIQTLAPRRDDPLRVILHELDGVPNLGSEELNDARDRPITLELTNRFAEVEDPHAAEKALWVQAKRSVLAILRVQPAKDLVDSLMQPVAEEHESMWEEIIDRELYRSHERRMPSTGGAETAYRLEDIQSLSFREVKAHAISCLLKLEKQGRVTRTDGYQGILDAIAGDVRSKHRKRIERQKELESIRDTLAHLAERKKNYMEQIESYNNYVEAAMQTMQRGKGKKRFVLPFTKQYFHLRDLQRSGQTPQFGSFKYSAQDLYDKGILLSIDQHSPRQFDRINIVLSSNKVGIFTVDLYNTDLGGSNSVVSTDVRLDDLLQAQFEDKVSLALFNGAVKFNVNLLLYQLNKKFYV